MFYLFGPRLVPVHNWNLHQSYFMSFNEVYERTKGKGEMGVQFVVLDMGGELSPFV